MAEVSVAILGLQRIGASIGLALKRYNTQKKSGNNFTITGYDTDGETTKQALKMQVIDNVASKPSDAVKDKDIVIITLPYGEVAGAYNIITPSLRAGAVILDASPLKAVSLDIAKTHLSDDIHVVCISPIFNPKYIFNTSDTLSEATEDLFDGGIMLIMPAVNCVKEAITLASDFSNILGALPQFSDAAEHDALMTGTETLPMLMGITLFHMHNQSKGWRDKERLTNPLFGSITRTLFDQHPNDIRNVLFDSGEPLVRYLDEAIEIMQQFRSVLAQNDTDAMDAIVENASKNYEVWINKRLNNNWEEKTDAPSPPGMLGTMFGGFFSNSGDKKQND